MKRASKKEIKEAIQQLKDKPMVGNTPANQDPDLSKLAQQKKTQRIRKQGV